MAELTEVKQMLDLKSGQINAKEAELKKREQAFNREKIEAAKELENAYRKKMFDAQAKFDKESKKLEKKLLTTERNIATKLKLFKSK